MIAVASRPQLFREGSLDQSLARDGFAVLDLLDTARVAECRRIYERWASQHADPFSTTIQSRNLEYRQAVHEALSALLAPHVTRLLADYRITCAGFAVKQPSTSGGTLSLHRDISMVPEEGRTGLSLWCPLVSVDRANGCLQIAAGSHLLQRRLRGPGTPPPGLVGAVGGRAPEFRELHLKAGEAVLFDPCLCHASGVNTGSEARPVVTAVLTPIEAPLLYCHRAESASGPVLEVFEVPEDFYLRHSIGTRPAGCKLIRTVSEAA